MECSETLLMEASRQGENEAERVRELVDAVYRSESRPVLATLIRLVGDFDRAEEAMQDAFAAAVEQWPQTGVPANPRAWLISTGRFKAIDALRRRARFESPRQNLCNGKKLSIRLSVTSQGSGMTGCD
jgi:RNA polymerase sigma-70 factor, ECF subfamily